MSIEQVHGIMLTFDCVKGWYMRVICCCALSVEGVSTELKRCRVSMLMTMRCWNTVPGVTVRLLLEDDVTMLGSVSCRGKAASVEASASRWHSLDTRYQCAKLEIFVSFAPFPVVE